MKNWKFIKVENKGTPELRAEMRDIEEMIKNWEHAKSIRGVDVQKAQKIIDELRKDRAKLKLEIATGNESIVKQEWSMFNGLRNDAEKEIGNETYQHKLYPNKYVIIDGKNYKIITEGKVEKSGELTDAVLYGINQTYKRVPNSKTGNQSAQDRFLDDINGIKAKYKQEGKELNLSRLMYELKRIGWAESDFTKLKWPTNIGNSSVCNYSKETLRHYAKLYGDPELIKHVEKMSPLSPDIGTRIRWFEYQWDGKDIHGNIVDKEKAKAHNKVGNEKTGNAKVDWSKVTDKYIDKNGHEVVIQKKENGYYITNLRQNQPHKSGNGQVLQKFTF